MFNLTYIYIHFSFHWDYTLFLSFSFSFFVQKFFFFKVVISTYGKKTYFYVDENLVGTILKWTPTSSIVSVRREKTYILLLITTVHQQQRT